MSKLNDEVQIKDTANTVIGNSATMGRGEAVSRIKNVVQPGDIQNLSTVGLLYGLFKSNVPELSDQAHKQASEKLAKMLTTTDPKVLEQIRKEVAEKGFAQNILQKYIPNLGTMIGRTAVNPNVVGVGTASALQPISEGGYTGDTRISLVVDY